MTVIEYFFINTNINICFHPGKNKKQAILMNKIATRLASIIQFLAAGSALMILINYGAGSALMEL